MTEDFDAPNNPETHQEIALEELSDEILSLMLSKLPLQSLAILSCTSKRMHRLCHDPQFWTSVKLNDSLSDLTPFSVSVLCGKGAFIRHLCIDLHRTVLPDSVLHYLACSCPSLVSLSLYMNGDTTLTGTPRVNAFPIDELAAFLTNSKFIRSLRFIDSVLIDDSHLVRVLPHLQMMREIDLSGCGSLSDSTLIKLAQQCPSLQILDISRLAITGRCIEQIFRYCGGLRVLRANGCSDFQNDAFDSVHPDYLKSLTELSLVQTPAGLEQALICCVGLKALLASTSLHDSLLIPFVIQNKNLEVLHMGSGCRVTIASLLSAIQNCGPHLKSLTFHPYEDFAVPSDEAIRLICANCPKLKFLSLAHSRAISTYWVIQLLEKLKIESLALFGWEDANSSTLRMIAPHVGNLKMFCTTGCKKLTAKGIVNFINACPKLTVVKFNETGANVDPNGKLDPQIIESIRQQFPNVTENPPGTLLLQ
ncbi:hypothetical protein M9Y10_000822 [Tritrichomonas musculus]|uniref:F-box domain-containing protein n=1 Tax=Tritrichomonas musculus TaxID=1915356 RepID=A0ABR2L694_9EUKA